MDVQYFLTAYDPSDLPSASIDPLGFDRGYLFLADKLLPGLTNVASRPRYFSLLCLGASLASTDSSLPAAKLKRLREEAILRLERLWGLGCVLASREAGASYDPEPTSGPVPSTPPLELWGLRGLTYSAARAEELEKKKANKTDANFKLLLSQARYGVLGIYGVVADSLRFWDRDLMELTPDLGWRLAETFRKETRFPREVEQAIKEDGAVSLSALAAWGARAHISGSAGPGEAECFNEALHFYPVRTRMARLLEAHTPREVEGELPRLQRLRRSIPKSSSDIDLAETIDMILAYERLYRTALLGFERLLWLCRTLPGGFATLDAIRKDDVFAALGPQLEASVQDFFKFMESGGTEHFRKDLPKLDDVAQFARSLGESVKSPAETVLAIMARHADVQHGKFDQGRRKSPWVEMNDGRIALTMTRVGGLNREATSPNQISPHPYRLGAADALLRTARKP